MSNGEEIHAALTSARISPESSLAAKLSGEDTVRMAFDRNIGVMLDDHSSVKFERDSGDAAEGPFFREVPESLVANPYLAKAGVKLAPADAEG